MMPPKRKLGPPPSKIVKDFNDVRATATRKRKLPKAVKKSLDCILKETMKRYKKFGYTGYLAHAETLKEYFE